MVDNQPNLECHSLFILSLKEIIMSGSVKSLARASPGDEPVSV
jgi:hypothetical protein